MKNLFKNIWKIAPVLLIAMISGCEKDLFDDALNHKKDFKYGTMDFNQVARQNPKAANTIAKFRHDLSTDVQLKSTTDFYGFEVDTTKITYVEKEDGYKSYSLSIEQEPGLFSFKNLVLSEYPDGKLEVKIVKFNLSKTAEEVKQENSLSASTTSQEVSKLNPLNNTVNFYDCIEIGYYELVSACEGNNLGAEECYDQSGHEIMYEVFVILAQECSFGGSGGTGGNYGNGGGPMGVGNGGNGGSEGNGEIFIPNLLSNTEAELPQAVPLGLALEYFQNGLESEVELPLYVGHPEFREYLAYNNCDFKSREFVLNAINFLISNPNVSFEQMYYNRMDFDTEIADYDNNTEGNFDETVYANFNPQQAWENIPPVIPLGDFVGWGTPGIKRNCMDYAKAQIAKNGYQISNYGAAGQTFQIYTEQNGSNPAELAKGLSYLVYALSNGIPVIVGVDDQPGSPNPGTDNSTDHFITIVGMGTDSNGKYFTFYDNASGNETDGANPGNKLYYNPVTGIISGHSHTAYANGSGMHNYIVTQIRKSKPKN